MAHAEAELQSVALSDEDLGLLFASTAMGDSGSLLGSLEEPTTAARRVSMVPPPKRVTATHRAHKKPRKTSTKRKNGKNTAAAGSGVVPARCGYRTGKCQNLQAVKRNGKLHKLCEFHREKANMNQKKLDRKKRLQRSQFGGSHELHSSCAFSCTSHSSEDDAHSLDLEWELDSNSNNNNHSPRTIDERAVMAGVFPLGLTDARVRPTSLHEAPLALGVEELAIFCSLMTFDSQEYAPWSRAAPPSHAAHSALGPSVHFTVV